MATHADIKPCDQTVSTAKRIVRAAIDEFGEKGVDLATIEGVAARAGTSKQLVYHYFRNKEVLYSEAMDEISRVEHRSLFDVDYESLPPLAALDRFFSEVLNTNLSNDRLFVADQILHYGTGRNGGKEIGRAGRRALRILEDIVRRGQAQQVIDAGLTAPQLYMHMLLLSSGFRIFRPLMFSYIGEDFTVPAAMAEWQSHARRSILAAIKPGGSDERELGGAASLT